MNYKDILPDFIDGLLSPEEERAMHYQLSQDEELFREYKNLKEIFNSINESKNSYIPSAELTQKVFNSLDMRYFPSEKKTSIFKNIYNSTYKYAATIITLLILLTLQFNNLEQLPGNRSNNSIAKNSSVSSSNINNENNFTSENNFQESNINNIQSKNLNNIKRSTQKLKKYNNNYKLSESNIESNNDNKAQNRDLNEELNLFYKEQDIKTKYNLNNNSSSDYSSEAENSEDLASASSQNHNYMNDQEPNFNNSEFRTPINLQQGFLGYNSDFAYNNYQMTYFSLPSDKFSIEIKNTIYFNTVNTKLNTELINIGLALYYNIIENLSLGIDIRNESFQKLSYKPYTPTLEKSYSYNFQNTLDNANNRFASSEVYTTTLGLAIKYNWKDISKVIIPTAQINIGTNSEGLVGRLHLGMYVNAFNGVSANVGLEYSTLAYKFANSSNNTNKIGINCGLAYNFK